MPLAAIFATAFLEGLCVLVIEILGARALAPYFGGSLIVWTAQITATLLFLALGYRLGGRLARRPGDWQLPALFALAGSWLFLYRLVRIPLMTAMAGGLGIGAGSFASASALFGVPLACLGAVSPVLIGAIDRARPGAGSAAGSLFFVNTLGGLAGGWATAFVVIPHLAVSTALASTGALLVALAGLWFGARRGWKTAAGGFALAGAIAAALLALATRAAPLPPGKRLLEERQTFVGLLQVVEDAPSGRRTLLLDGSTQNEIDARGGSTEAYTYILEVLAAHFAPSARRALALGLGAGIVPRTLAGRGVAVTAVEIEPAIEEAARQFFRLPDEVTVTIADARTFLRRDRATYDLVVLDVFAAESAPWHLMTVEALGEIAARLEPGGRLLINTYTTVNEENPGLGRLEAALLAVFPEAMVFVGAPDSASGLGLTTAVLVAGDGLAATPAPSEPGLLDDLLANGRPARAGGAAPTDDWSDLDYAEARLRLRYRQVLFELVPPIGG